MGQLQAELAVEAGAMEPRQTVEPPQIPQQSRLNHRVRLQAHLPTQTGVWETRT